VVIRQCAGRAGPALPGDDLPGGAFLAGNVQAGGDAAVPVGPPDQERSLSAFLPRGPTRNQASTHASSPDAQIAHSRAAVAVMEPGGQDTRIGGYMRASIMDCCHTK
jgi:hypothetical protein